MVHLPCKPHAYIFFPKCYFQTLNNYVMSIFPIVSYSTERLWACLSSGQAGKRVGSDGEFQMRKWAGCVFSFLIRVKSTEHKTDHLNQVWGYSSVASSSFTPVWSHHQTWLWFKWPGPLRQRGGWIRGNGCVCQAARTEHQRLLA